VWRRAYTAPLPDPEYIGELAFPDRALEKMIVPKGPETAMRPAQRNADRYETGVAINMTRSPPVLTE
jgi:hypothetical protein